ncbi:BRO-N domain-containing protein [Enterobacter roggenkampii]|uniref:BRO-N domain-containing protein n=1 Tax=Enterobacter roggenkampii TaxID=1812935 RepID=UPI0020062F3E|nr:Bro-N domain-containing protein [Enterobacter roggenkampii]MCK6978771.1 Bro-N domain-containing protein [Enterobacter roggenkampii]
MLKHKNVEAPAALTVRASVSNKSSDGSIDMNIVHNNELTFQNINFAYMEVAGQIWLTAAQVGEALGYSDDKAIHRLYRKHADEFTANMTGVVKVATPGGVQDSRVFSLRGAHLMGMFSRTPVAKEFRRWVLDVLDRELANGNVSPAFNFEMHAHNAKVALDYAEFIYQHWCEEIRPSLSLVGSPLANSLNERIKVLASITYGLNSGLAKAAKEKGMIH